MSLGIIDNMINEKKTIRDPIHGDIQLEGLFVELLESPEIQRLYNIKQLGLAHLVFPGAHHTRLEHSLGVYHVASKASSLLGIDNDEKMVLTCAAMLHDIGHGPFSHTLESIVRNTLNVDHVDLSEELILGKYDISEPGEKHFINSSNVYEILNNYGMNSSDIIDVIRGKINKSEYLSLLLNSSIDVDQLDYLLRDAYYTGVAYGMIDIERFLQTLMIFNNTLAVEKKGIGVIENILMARTLMYSSIYFHKTVRIAELMLLKAIELIPDLDPFYFFKMTDSELLNYLKDKGVFQLEIATRLKYRKLFKQAYTLDSRLIDDSYDFMIKKLEDPIFRREKEIELENEFNIPHGHVIIDIPYPELHVTEPRINQTNITIIDDDNIRSFDDLTPIANAIKLKKIPDWKMMIVTDEKHREILSKNAQKIIFS